MTQIKGPDGRTAEVNTRNELTVSSVSQDIDQASNLDGNVFSIEFSVTPAAADDYFFYLKNEGTSNIVLGELAFSSSVATKLYVDVVSGTPTYVTGADATVTNRNLGKSTALSVEAKYDTDITTLTSEGVLTFEEASIVDTKFNGQINSGIIIPQGKAIAIRRVAATGLITALLTVGISTR